jgi:phospholipid/cholesterol/gamma-HCH transport system substrate-binding protein
MTLTALRESFGDIRKVTGRLERGEGTIGKLLMDDAMYDELRETVASLNVTAENAAEITERINRGHGTIGRLVADDALYDQAEGALRGVTRATQGIEDQAPISVVGTLLGTLF